MRALRVTLGVLMMVGARMTEAGAQTPAADPSARLREVLPADVAARVLATIADARSRQLPATAVAALENRALKYAARGVAPADVERAVRAHAGRMHEARAAIESGRGAPAAGDEIDAGAEAMRQGVDGAAVSALAKAAPSGRSLTVPLFVVGSMVERGLPADQALARVRDRLAQRASDREIERIGREQGRGPNGAPGGGRPTDPGANGRPADAPSRGKAPAVPPGRRP